MDLLGLVAGDNERAISIRAQQVREVPVVRLLHRFGRKPADVPEKSPAMASQFILGHIRQLTERKQEGLGISDVARQGRGLAGRRLPADSTAERIADLERDRRAARYPKMLWALGRILRIAHGERATAAGFGDIYAIAEVALANAIAPPSDPQTGVLAQIERDTATLEETQAVLEWWGTSSPVGDCDCD